MKVLLAGGGTAGHINPAIAIANEINARYPGSEFLFAATPRGMEADLVPKSGYPVSFIKLSGFNRSFHPADVLHNCRSAWYLALSNHTARKMIKSFAPDVVVGTGGYLSGPIVRAAARMKIPTLIHEQNAFPGVTTKLLSREVDMVMLAFSEAKQRLPQGVPSEVVGNPVRQEFISTSRQQARKALGLDDSFTILSFGGSLGARAINEMALDLMEWHCHKKNINHIHGYGKNGKEIFPKALLERGVSLDAFPRIQIKEYIDNIYLYVAAADLVISRAGASSIIELEVTGTPSILVPYPYAAENHQYYNAKVLEDNGAAVIIEEKDYQKEKLIQLVDSFVSDPEKQIAFSENAKRLAVYDTAKRIVDLITKTVESKR